MRSQVGQFSHNYHLKIHQTWYLDVRPPTLIIASCFNSNSYAKNVELNMGMTRGFFQVTSVDMDLLS